MKNFFKITLILSILFFAFICINAYSYVHAVSQDLSQSIFRLHIIANSDSDEDQNLKYIVRDNLLEYMNELCSNCSSKSEAISIATEHLNDFQKIAEQTIAEQGFSYPVTVTIGNFEFPTKNYGDISFPAGNYDALKVEIGENQGHNWWCVMFPPLCFVNTTTGIVSDSSKEQLQASLDDEGYKIISDSESSSITVKFKLIELFQNLGL